MHTINGALSFGFLCLACHCLVHAAPGEQSLPDVKPTDAAALIEQLGDAKYSRRQAAVRKLIEIGPPAMSAIQRYGIENFDREIRSRSQSVLKKIRKIDLQRRLAAFAANLDDERDFGLPGWKKYRQLVGNTVYARGLFVRMLKAEAQLIREVETNPQMASKMLDVRAVELNAMIRSKVQPSLGTVAALLFVTSYSEAPVSQMSYYTIYTCCDQENFRNEITPGSNRDLVRKSNSDLVRKLLGAWIRRGEGSAAHSSMNMAMQYDLKDGLVPAVKVLTTAGQKLHMRPFALLTIAKLGDRSHFPLLEKMLEDETQYTSFRVNNKRLPIQVRDIALGALLHISGQDLKKYGFNHVQTHSLRVFNPSTLVFDSDEMREKALQKWKQYRAEEKQKESP